MKVSSLLAMAIIVGLICLSLPACSPMQAEDKESHQEKQKIVVTSPETKNVVITQQYVCQIHARRHIEVRALEEGYLEEITVKEGQAVKQGDVLFRVIPVLFKAKLEAEKAEAKYAEIKLLNSKRLFEQKIVSEQEVKLYEAELAKAQAKVQLAEAELKFTEVKASYDGIIDRLYKMQGSLVKKEEILTTLADNSLMWVYFNVPEARYLEYKERQGKSNDISQLKLPNSQIELVLANGSKFPYSAGDTVTVEGNFNNMTGNIPFRADFPNPDRLLRHGQTGTVVIHHALNNAIVIPQRATFEVLDKRYVFVVGEDHVVHRRLITIQYELEDVFIIKSGLDVKDKIIFEGVREVNDGDKPEFEFRKPEEILAGQKFHAE